MAKVTNYNEVIAAIEVALQGQDYFLVDLVGHDLAVLAILNIYMTNDVCKGFGQDFHNGTSIISSRQRISVIVNKNSSMFKDDFNICLYDDLSSDIAEIIIISQAAYDRIQFT